MEYKDYYKTLNVPKSASVDDIKKSYRRLARKYHPDVSKEANAEEHFKDVQEAYEVLKDPEKRKAYDTLGSDWKQGQDFRPPPHWGDQFEGARGAQGEGTWQQFSSEEFAGAEGFSDFFSQLFGARGRGRQGAEDAFGGMKHKGQDQHAKISITLSEAFHGATKIVQLQVPEHDAAGRLHHVVRTLKVVIPPGATQGQQLRLAKQGAPGMGGGPAGDLYLAIAIQPDALYTLKGKDLYLTLPITPWEAALGATIKVPTLAGAVTLKVAAGSQSGQKLRLKGRGMPDQSGAGDQYAVLTIETPPAHDAAQRAYYTKMAEILPFNPRKAWAV